MTVTDQIKIIDSEIKSNQSHYDLGRETVKISALSSKDLLEKHEYLTGEDLGHKPSVFENAKFEYFPFKKDEVKSVAKSKSGFNYDSKHTFYRFYRKYDEFEEMSLNSKYNRMKNFNELLIDFKAIKTKGANYEKCRRALRKVL